MKRDPRLRTLSSDHHRALVMARRMERAGEAEVVPTPEMLRELEAFCREELAPHFAQEEKLLLPALERHGEQALVERTLREHAEMMELAEHLEQREALRRLAQLLKQHVRFEEQELFEVAQAKLTAAELDALAAH